MAESTEPQTPEEEAILREREAQPRPRPSSISRE
jgi:hypothetical protein